MPWIYPNAFEDEVLKEKFEKSLEEKGITIVRECKVIEVLSHNSGDNLTGIVLKRLDIPEEEEEEDEFEQEE
jgi:NADPH-dependent 2,4-dienoyl-CoA reductase/sulfur reductase-like enzyme